MQKSRTRGAELLALTSIIRQSVVVILNFVSRTLFIRILGAEYLGINGLFSNVLSILALSELGIGAAISFYLYKPIVDEDEERIKSIMHFYKICYRYVGLFIVFSGIACTPFLKYLVNFESSIDINLHLVFILYILNTAGTYFFYSYKQTLAYANQEGYKIEKYVILFSVVSCLVDCIVLVILRNYYAYLIIKFLLILLKNLYIGKIIDKEYPYILSSNFTRLGKKEIKTILQDVLNISVYKAGSALYSATDNMIISSLIGTIVVGYYSNYVLLVSQVLTIINLVANSFVAGIGNVVAKEKKEKRISIFKEIDLCVFALILTTCVLLTQLLNPFVKIWIGDYNQNYVLPIYIIWIIVFNCYLDASILVLTAFREASGHFEIGKWAQLIGGFLNILLSILWGKWIGLVGIFLATSICKLLTTIIPIVLKTGSKVFSVSGKNMLSYYLFHTGIVVLTSISAYYIGNYFIGDGIGELILRMISSIILSLVFFLIFFHRKAEFKSLCVRFRAELQNRKNKN